MAKIAAKLSPTLIDKLDIRPTAYRVWDTKVPSLHIRVQPSGVKSWNLQWDRSTTRALGKYPGLTVDAARAKATALLVEVTEHGAPLAVLADIKATQASTFGEFMTEYGPHIETTNKAGKQTVANIKKQFGYLYDTPMREIDKSVIDKFRAKRMKQGRKPATINRDVDRIKAALFKAVEWKVLDNNPLAGVKRDMRGVEERVRYLTPKEAKALRAALLARETEKKKERASANAWREARHRELLPALDGYTDHLMPMTLLALNTGMRLGELTTLAWQEINFDHQLLTVRAGYAKSGKLRHIPLNKEAMGVLTQWKKQHPEGRLFPVKKIDTAWENLIERAGIDDFHFHDCRHDFASHLVMAGVDLNTVRELMGHADIKMTLRYAHLAPEHKASAVAALEGQRKKPKVHAHAA